jgi:hypothetical protein
MNRWKISYIKVVHKHKYSLHDNPSCRSIPVDHYTKKVKKSWFFKINKICTYYESNPTNEQKTKLELPLMDDMMGFLNAISTSN